MALDTVIRRLRDLNEPVPTPPRLPTDAEVSAAEQQLGVTFHSDFRRYLLEASDVVFGTIEPATITRPNSHTHLSKICGKAWKAGVDRKFLPICAYNGDYYCINVQGEVLFLSHNGWSSETWPDLATWIEQVWIEGSA